jgi:hypothetical protein
VRAAEARWLSQWQLTAAYLIARCETVILVRGPDSADPWFDRINAWAEAPASIPSHLRPAATDLLPAPTGTDVVELRAPTAADARPGG